MYKAIHMMGCRLLIFRRHLKVVDLLHEWTSIKMMVELAIGIVVLFID